MKLYVPVYSITLLLSAILLFTVQPMFSKMILPLLGGTPQVWTTAMLFFQLNLLAGYAYAHGTTRLFSIRVQAILHIILLAIFTIALPFAIPAGWTPPEGENPTFWQLSLMTITVGGPFFIVSGSAPMFQRWFSVTDHQDASNPYFLYGASNLGSMSALLSYPFIIEPLLTLNEQTETWMFGYLALIAITALCLLLVWTKSGKNSVAAETPQTHTFDDDVTTIRRLKWIILSFTPSSLMLGVTTFITTDIASAPLLWILPLSLYIGTFIIVFARKPLLSAKSIDMASALAVAFLIAQMIAIKEMHAGPMLLIGLHLLIFFAVALMCHTELANSRPSAKHLTEFYLIISLGGALGGIFNAIIAPTFFIVPIEYAIALGIAMFMRHTNDPEHSFAALKAYIKSSKLKDILTNEKALFVYFIVFLSALGFVIQGEPSATNLCAMLVIALLVLLYKTRWPFAIAATLTLLISPISFPLNIIMATDVLHQDRNFFGIIKIIEEPKQRMLMHGTTNHGTQPTQDEFKLRKISYYSDVSPLSDVFDVLDQQGGEQKVGVIGLGVGVISCYTYPGRSYDFYEIDKDIADIAENREFFTYLSDCGSPYKIILGDGRLKIEEKPNKHYDAIIIDAFSSDNIPIHLLTKEAIQIYLDRVKDDGLVVLHISNNYIDLEPVVGLIGKTLGYEPIAKLRGGTDIEDIGVASYPSHYFVISKNPQKQALLVGQGWTDAKLRDDIKPWTDQYSNLISVLRNDTMQTRFKEEFERLEKEAEEQEASDEDKGVEEETEEPISSP